MKEIKTQKKYPIFRNIEENDIMALIRCFSAKIMRPQGKSKIISEGEKLDYIYIVVEGTCAEIIYDDEGNVATLIEYNEGDVMGLDYYISNRRTFKNDIFALKDSVIILLDAFRLLNPCENYCPRHTKVLQNLIIQIAKQKETLEQRVKNLSFNNTRKKVMFFLYNYHLKTRRNEFDIPYNRQELAYHLGVERSALSKELSDMQKDGLIEFHKNHFKILE